MRLLILLLLLTSPLLAKEKKKKVVSHAVTSGSAKSIMIIEPQARAKDYIVAYDKMRSEIPSAKIYFQLEHQRPVNNVLSLELMQNGTLMLFRISSPLGTSYKVVPIEDIIEITHE